LKWIESDGLDKQRHLITWRGKPITTVFKTWVVAKKRAGIKRRLRLYDLRHFWATHLLTHGGDLKTVSAALGHSSPALTLQIYSHISSDVLEKAIDTLPDLKIKKPPEKGRVVSLKSGN